MSRSGRRTSAVLPPKARKAVLTAHVIASVAWIGLSVCLLVLGLTGLLHPDPQVSRAAYIALGVVVTPGQPISGLALVSGIALSLGTKWGLLRHWWVVVSLVLTAVMTALVQLSLAPLMRGAAAKVLAAAPEVPAADAVGGDAVSIVVAPAVAITALSFVAAINVYKPWGRTSRSGPANPAATRLGASPGSPATSRSRR
ncbi:hypothetical protein A8924_0022 [Saccharopolyspora erythraea NRRL 2338]|uniref:Membrane protein n=2 Tax=Saccharopolyspora erythraea TaxID=1836 RepID=A4FQ80_SACEN|nr:hypothetical protein [Saccharopolyspora erythraea]EQD86330.1 membrane protein [Saccharopolyspora erythraea D]PFG92805.1 hypothetical protein A8924_0022 [Saccharopolyspora erythraea NRRL 2338]QRK89720.1 hypothetical protein JQX30_35280 [Saccharopolyspora erythraea]CAM06205.1 membrane protein [Saccharopolyspora erythraea NRRL 2338]